MKKLLFLGILLFTGYISKAQRVYFIYLQSENATPFYVKMGDRIHSSSTAGYSILSNLKDSVYSLSVGLAGKQQAEPKFKIAIANGDRGFLIKELDQKLTLFDFHTMQVIEPLALAEVNKEDFVTRSDNFTRTLSQVANDPTLLQEAVRKEPVKEQVRVKPTIVIDNTTAALNESSVKKSIVKDSIVSSNENAIAKALKKDTINSSTQITLKDAANAKETGITQDTGKVADLKSTSETIVPLNDSIKVIEPLKESESKEEVQILAEHIYKRSTVVRRSESSTSEGFGLTFIDHTLDGSDTIRLLIPNPKVPFKMAELDRSATNNSAKTKEDQEIASTVTGTADIISVTNNCKDRATDGDFRRLRKEMAAQENDAEMLQKAKDIFQLKCFTVEQVKNLSTLFLTPEGKYLFFEGVIKNVSDIENVATLVTELKDEVYSNRFKALMNK